MASRVSPYVDNTGLVFAYDLANIKRSYLGEPTTNLVNPDWSAWSVDGSGQGSIGTRTLLSTYHYRIVDASANTRQYIFAEGISANTQYTFSVKFLKISGTPTLRFQIQSYNGGSYINAWFPTTVQIGVADIEGWQTAEYTVTTPANTTRILWFMQDGDDYTTYTHSFELKEPQIEAKSHSTQFTAGTRSVTQGLRDLTGNSTIDLTNVSFDANAQMTFDGTNDLITLADAAHLKFSNGSFTVEQVLNINSISGKQRTFSKGSSGWTRGWHAAARPTQWEFELSDGVSTPGNGFLINTATTVGTNHVVWVIESAATAKLYVNGVQVGSTQTITESVDFATTTSTVGIGAFESGGEYFNGRIPYTRLYARALTASEIQQNFNAIKGRYGL